MSVVVKEKTALQQQLREANELAENRSRQIRDLSVCYCIDSYKIVKINMCQQYSIYFTLFQKLVRFISIKMKARWK